MKRMFVGLLVLLFCFLVVAESSEITTEFTVGVVEEAQDYVVPVSFWDLYSGYIVGLIIVLIVLIVFFKNKKVSKVSGKVKKKSKKVRAKKK